MSGNTPQNASIPQQFLVLRYKEDGEVVERTEPNHPRFNPCLVDTETTETTHGSSQI